MKFSIEAILFTFLTPAFGLEDWVFGTIDATLPKAVSDHTAVRSPGDGLIYLAGGCDSADGNVWNADAKTFLCGSVTDSFYSFDPVENQFKTLASLPQARYRHSSAVADNKVWVIGGRNLDDDLVAGIDVYDIETGDWSTIGNLPDEYLVSDHASFVHDDIYIAGGYDGDYVAQKTVLKIGFDGSTFEEASPLNVGRGDIVGVASSDGSSAYVAGGFSNQDWCQPLVSVEEYDFGTDSWTGLPDLIEARGEIVLVENRNHLYSLGGEAPLDYGDCTNETYEVGTKTVATDSIELLMDGETSWKVLETFPEERFRFAAVGEDDVIYTFGGQIAFDVDCSCFRVSDGVFIFGAAEDVAAKGTIVPKDAASTKSIVAGLVACVFSFIFL
eukprot:scaffold4518_cov149-Cylindrotheca_fusiformis.AAC.13